MLTNDLPAGWQKLKGKEACGPFGGWWAQCQLGGGMQSGFRSILESAQSIQYLYICLLVQQEISLGSTWFLFILLFIKVIWVRSSFVGSQRIKMGKFWDVHFLRQT